MPTIILYAVELAEMERWLGSRDASLLREAKQMIREDPDAGWEREEIAVLDRLLERMIQQGRLYENLGSEETYYLTQLLIDLFDEMVESEAVSDEFPLEALDQALGQLRPATSAVENARRWLIQGRLLGTDRTVWDRSGDIEELLPYFGYLRRAELEAVTAALPSSASPGGPPRAAPRGRSNRGALQQLQAACREARDTERDLVSFVS